MEMPELGGDKRSRKIDISPEVDKELITRYVAGEATAEEIQTLMAQLGYRYVNGRYLKQD